jgi:hypothetical protein
MRHSERSLILHVHLTHWYLLPAVMRHPGAFAVSWLCFSLAGARALTEAEEIERFQAQKAKMAAMFGGMAGGPPHQPWQ